MKFLVLFLASFSCYGQISIPTFQSQFFSGRATSNNRNFSAPITSLNSQRMTPFYGGNTQQQLQTQPQKKEPLRAHNNRYPVNRSNTMGFGSYRRLNLRDHKAQALAAQKYKEKLSVMRLNLRAYRIQPTTPVTPIQPQPQPNPQPNPEPQPNPNDGNGGEVGIGGGEGSNPPEFPSEPQPRPAVLPIQQPSPIAIGMPAPEPR